MKTTLSRTTITICIFTVLLVCSAGWSQQEFGNNSSIFSSDVGQKRIDLDILNMDIESVLKIISDTSGWTIIPSQKIRGKVSLWSKGATAHQLLDRLAMVNNYVYQKDGNVVFLMTNDEYEDFFGRISKTFSLKHQKAENIKQLLENSMTRTGKLGIDSWSNTIIVNDTAENIKKIESLITGLDQGFVQKRFQLANAKADDVATALDKLCPKEGPFQADVRTNSVIVFNSQSNVDRIAALINQLDKNAVTRIFQIRFQKASELASEISVFLHNPDDTKSSKASSQIVVSEATNQIIITTSPSKLNYIAGIIEELDSKVITTTIHLKHLKASEVLAQVVNLASKPENITVDSQGNKLVVHDNTYNIEQIRKVIQDLDEALVTKVFTLEHAMAEDIENVLSTLVTNSAMFRAEARTNQIIICDGASQVARIEGIIKKLDREDAYFTRTYNLKYASASHVANIIESFMTRNKTKTSQGYNFLEQTSSQSSSPLKSPELHRTGVTLGTSPGLAAMKNSKRAAASPPFPTQPTVPLLSPGPAAEAAQPDSKSLGTAGTVVADDRSNTIIITETLATLTRIEQLIQQLDVSVELYSYTIKCRQMDSLDLENRLTTFLRPDKDSFAIDNQTHSVHFTTIPSIAEKMLKMLKELDRPAKQALIRAKIVAINSSKFRDIGINFESLFDVSGVDIIFGGSLPSQVGADHFGSITVRQLTGTQYEATIRAIEADNNNQILASPHILVLDGQSAEVRMATDEPFTETSIDSENGNTIENVRFLQVGTVLMVRPNIKEDDTIEMEISLDVSSLAEIRNGIPVVNHNIASSTVAVKNNHVLMIGGLKYKRDINVEEKIPVLGDIPLVGTMFRSSRKELADSELILLLQPSIVSDSEIMYEPSTGKALETLTPKPDGMGRK